ncbi:Zinc finger, PMZ-type [Sesbania bispinosa]|nr:Zinc finger, PMZ-type [Sesbania bispinosa]
MNEFGEGCSRMNGEEPMMEALNDLRLESEEVRSGEDTEGDLVVNDEEEAEDEGGGFQYRCVEDNGENNDGERIEINNVGDIVKLDLKNLSPHEVGLYYDFQSLELAADFYKSYARKNGFAGREGKKRHNKDGVVIQQAFVCNREGFRRERDGGTPSQRKRRANTRCGCKAEFRVHVNVLSGRWYVTWFDDDHNHDLMSDAHCGMLPAHQKMSKGHVMQMNNFLKAGIRPPHILAAFARQAGGYEKVGFRKKHMYNQIGQQRRNQGDDGKSAIGYLQWLGLKDSLMCCKHVEDANGSVRHMFWSNGLSQISYQEFGDVLAFDATYRKNKYRYPVVIFSGVNHHNHTTIFACGIVSNETEETYVWLLEQFNAVMKGKSPVSVITDGDLAMRNAIKRVYPNAHHRLCAWHLIRNATSNVSNPGFTAAFTRCMLGDYDIGQFKRKWPTMVNQFGLQENRWVREMYDKRKMWATAYIRGNFFAGFRTTSRCEGLHSQIRKYVHSQSSLTEFVQQFQRCLYEMRFREAEADFASVHGEPEYHGQLRSLQISATKLFTREMFDIFLPVLDRAAILKVTGQRENYPSVIYVVQKYQVDEKEWYVTCNLLSNEYRCSCLRMESYGMPCDHMIAVLVYLNISEVPKCMVMQRWCRGAKSVLCGELGQGSNFWDTESVGRFASLLDVYYNVCRLASKSVDDYNEQYEKGMNDYNHLKEKNGHVSDDEESRRQGGNGGVRGGRIQRGRGRIGSTSSTPRLWSKRTTHCSLCHVAGHNRLTCPLREQLSEMIEQMYGTSIPHGDVDLSFSNEDFNMSWEWIGFAAWTSCDSSGV